MSWERKWLPSFLSKECTVEKEPRLGAFMGVFIPTILMLFGVIIFLRLGWIVGQVGLPLSLFMITLGALIAFLTILSIAAVATNIEIGKGGFYYILSRSLGLEVGCALGFPLYLKQTLSVSFCVVGFAESLHDLIPSWSITTIGVCTLIALTLLALNSLKGAIKLQVILFIILLASFISLFTGGNLPPQDLEIVSTLPVYNLGFWAIFAIFFPAMTGIESSVSLSGDLKDPSKSLPVGTISALLAAYGIYIAIAIFLVNHVPLDRLISDPLVIQDIATVPALIVVGIWGATLSSALGGILAAPRTLQAMAEDGVAPAIFTKAYGANGEPREAILFTFLIALFGVYFGSVNIIAPMLTMICLICYGVLNFSAGMEMIMENPSWRPRFSLHWTVSISGAVLSVIIMLMVDAGAAIASLVFVGVIYLIAKYRQINSSWEDIHQGILQFLSRYAVYQLAYAKEGSKSWRPHFLVFTSKPHEFTSNILSFSQSISKNKGFLTMASILQPLSEKKQTRDLEKSIAEKLQTQSIQAFVRVSYADNIEKGMSTILENYGLGSLKPNTVMFGGIPQGKSTIDFANVIQEACQLYYNVIIMLDNNTVSLDQLTAVRKGDIHIWWDEVTQVNGEFMLVLSYMLQKNPSWKKSNICVKSFVSSEINRQQKMEEFQAFASKNRLHLEIDVLVSRNPEVEFMDLVRSFSANAGIIFLGLRKPLDGEPAESYAAYLQGISEFSVTLPPIAFIMSSEHTPLKNFFNF